MDLKDLASKLKSKEFPLHFPGHWINSAWVVQEKAKIVKESINPNDGQLLIPIRLDKSAIYEAVDAAAAGVARLEQTTLNDRVDILRKFRQLMSDYSELFIEAGRIEVGKPKWEAHQEFTAALHYLDWLCLHADDIEQNLLAPARLGATEQGDYSLLPIGASLAFLPFSTPISSLVHYLSGTLLAGSPLVMVVSGHASICGLAACLISRMIEMPKGAFNVVFGNFTTLKHVLGDRRIRAILYTGSREHCQIIRQESRSVIGRELILQSGGKNAVIVHSTADIDLAVNVTLQGLTRSAGQLCTSTSRVFVYNSHLESFNRKLLEAAEALVIGRTDQDSGPDPDMGPLYSKKAVDKFLRFQTMAHREAKETLLWGKAWGTDGEGFFVRPGIHLMKGLDNASAFQSNVLFCPDLCIYSYDVLDDAIAKANETDAPYVVSFIGDQDILMQRRLRFSAPNLRVNLPTVENETTMPLSGRLHSGHHRFSGAGIALLLTYPQVIQSSQ